MAGTTFQEGLKTLFVYNFHRCFGDSHEIVHACGVVCGGCVGGVGSGIVGVGLCKDATANEGLGWFNAMKKEPLINTANLTLLKFV